MAFSHEESLTASRMLSSSISSLSSSRQQASQIAKAYRQAAQLFLTRRLPEALSTIEPAITPQPLEEVDGAQHGEVPLAAPIASASRGTRIKVWSFYLTFLNSVVELGPEEGKHAFGSTRWKAMVAKCRDGSIWEDVVRDGYGGVEGDVDAEVVINLATLLLTHMPDQKLTQRRLETYLSASAQPTFDISAHMQSSLSSPNRKRPTSHYDGTSTPRDLHTRLKLLELYTLHVLPRNDEWDYAREFISMSEVLDDERKEAFLLALHGLREEKQHAALREAELARQQREQLDQRRRETEARRQEESRAEDERRKREAETSTSSNRSRRPAAPKNRNSPPEPHASRRPAAAVGTPRHPTPPTPSASRQSHRPVGKKPPTPPPPPPPGFYTRASSLVARLQAITVHAAHGLTRNPSALLRTLLFALALALAFGRREVRDRIRVWLRQAADKVRRTVGMGVRVSYV